MIKFEDRRTWPAELRKAIKCNDFNTTRSILNRSSIESYHCTRLCADEVSNLHEYGFQIASTNFLIDRIRARLRARDVPPDVAKRLIEHNDSDRRSKSCTPQFSVSKKAYKNGGSERLFNYWGGEALFSCYEDDPEIGRLLSSIGSPHVLVIRIDIANIYYPCIEGIMQYFKECRAFDFSIKDSIPAKSILRVVTKHMDEFRKFI